MNTFEKIYTAVAHIPNGKVSSYGSVAKTVGMRNGAQVVGWALRALPPTTNIPWQRVVNERAEISIINPNFTANKQKELLEKEGLKFTQKNGIYTIINPPWFKLSPL